jgi:uncharacterized alkaline shock family protein YloU
MSENNEIGAVNISEVVVASVAGAAATECYGLVGMASRKLKDGIGQLLGKEDLTKGVEVIFEGEEVVLNLSIIVSYGTNVAEVARNVMERVKYNVEKQTGLKVKNVNINVQGVKIINES